MHAPHAEPPRCVVFDLDDTLFLERDYVRSGFDAAGAWLRAHLGLQGFAGQAWELFERGVRGTTFDDALAVCGVEPTEDVVTALVAVYRAHEPAIRMLPDARECVDVLRSTIALALVTDGPVEAQRAKARAMESDRWAQVAVFTGELEPGEAKPHPRAFREVETVVGESGAACVYVADNPAKDFAGPRRLGWRTVRIRRSGSLHEGLASGDDVDAELSDLAGLLALLGVTVL
jgi:putative hydrolase of the HAD superfamily